MPFRTAGFKLDAQPSGTMVATPGKPGLRYGMGQCVDVDSTDKREGAGISIDQGLLKIDGRWGVMHEHHSLTPE